MMFTFNLSKIKPSPKIRHKKPTK